MTLKVDISGKELVEAAIPLRQSWEKDMKELFLQILADEGLDVNKEDFYISVSFMSSGEMRELNGLYRGIDAPTDVLSFENDYLDPESGLHYLGDIVISIEKAQEQAANNGHPLQQEVEMLFVHGVLHLCGYDHAKEDEYAEMSRLQDEILTAMNNPLLGSISPPA